MLQAEDPQEDASAVLRAIQVENEALQRAILSRKAEPPSSLLQVQVRLLGGGAERTLLLRDQAVSERRLHRARGEDRGCCRHP